MKGDDRNALTMQVFCQKASTTTNPTVGSVSRRYPPDAFEQRLAECMDDHVRFFPFAASKSAVGTPKA